MSNLNRINIASMNICIKKLLNIRLDSKETTAKTKQMNKTVSYLRSVCVYVRLLYWGVCCKNKKMKNKWNFVACLWRAHFPTTQCLREDLFFSLKSSSSSSSKELKMNFDLKAKCILIFTCNERRVPYVLKLVHQNPNWQRLVVVVFSSSPSSFKYNCAHYSIFCAGEILNNKSRSKWKFMRIQTTTIVFTET